MEEMGMIVKIFIGILLIGISGFLLITVSDDFSNWITKLFRGDIENEVTQMCQQSQHVLFESGDISKEEFVKAAESVGWWVWKNDKPCVLEATVEDELTDDEIADPITKTVGSRFEAVGDDCLFTLTPIGGNDFTEDNALVFVRKEGLDLPGCLENVFLKTAVAATTGIIATAGFGAVAGGIGAGSAVLAEAAFGTAVGTGIGITEVAAGGYFWSSAHTADTLIIAKKKDACMDMMGPNYRNLAKTGSPDPELEKICTGSLEIPKLFCSSKTWIKEDCKELQKPDEIPCNYNEYWKNRCKQLGKAETDKVNAANLKLGYISSDKFLLYKLGICFEVFNKEVKYDEKQFPCFAEIYTFYVEKPVTLTQFYSRIKEVLGQTETLKKFSAYKLEACDWTIGTLTTNCIHTTLNNKQLSKGETLNQGYYSAMIYYFDDVDIGVPERILAENDMIVVMTTTIQDIFELKPPQ